MKTVWRLLAFLTPFRGWVLLSIVLGCALVACNMGLLGMAAYLIAAAALKPLLIVLTLPIYIVRVMGIARPASRYAERLVSHNVTFHVLGALRTWLFSRLVPLAPGRLVAYRSGDVLARLVGDVEELQNVYLRVVSPLVVAVAIAGLTWALFAIFSPVLAWTALAFLIATGFGIPLLVGGLVRGLGRRQMALQADLSAHLVDSIQGVQDLLAFGQEGAQQQAIAALDRALGRLQRRMALITGLGQALHDLLMNLAWWAILLLAIPLVAGKSIDGVYLAFLAIVLLAAFEAVQPLSDAFGFLGRAIAAGERLFEVVDAPPPVQDTPRPLLGTRPAPIVAGTVAALEFEQVCFAYGPDEDTALCGVTFRLAPGRRVAIVGPSGAGKSTLARLALRYWDPLGGAIRLHGHDIRTYALDDLRGAMAVVAQDTALFTDTVRGNLLLAQPGATDAELLRALEQAQLAQFVQDLPLGLDTWVGEQGLRLSGGERQRLAIARALLKDAPLLILDEATANLDPPTEQAVLEALDTLMQGRTTLMITHRLVALERMDEILVLDGGRIVERGTHDELQATQGLYRRLLDLQNGMLAIT